MPQKFRKKNRQPEYSYSERRECIELQFSEYWEQCMCGHEFADDYDWDLDEEIWDELYDEEDYG